LRTSWRLMLPFGAFTCQPPLIRLRARRLPATPALPGLSSDGAGGQIAAALAIGGDKMAEDAAAGGHGHDPGSGPNAPEPASVGLVLSAVGRKLVTLPPAVIFTLPPAAVLMPPRNGETVTAGPPNK